MGRGRQVADAYIEVHGDLAPFRESLNKANGGMEKWAEENADSLSEAWGNRMRSQMDRQWGSVVDAMYSGEKLDFNRMLEAFDAEDHVAAFSKIDDMMKALHKQGKLNEDDMVAMSSKISEQISILEKQKRLEEGLARDRTTWGQAHQKMMAERAVAMQQQSDSERKMLTEAFAENARFDALTRKRKAEDAALDARWHAKRKKMLEEAFAENEKWSRSFNGVAQAAARMDLENRFKALGQAMATNDWSGLAKGVDSMDELGKKTIHTAKQMNSLGRMTDQQFEAVQQRLRGVNADMAAYNVHFDEANDSAAKQVRDWTIIHNLVGNAGKKFAGFAGLNVVGDVFRDGAAFLQDLDRNALKIGKMALSIGTMGSAVVHLIGGIAVAGQDLAKVGQIGILAPAFLTAAAIQAAVLGAALKDMSTVLADLGPRFGELQDKISSNFWAVAEKPIRNLANNLLPTLSAKLGTTAVVWGAMFAEMANSLDSISTDDISTMFDRMNSSINIARGAVNPLIQAFKTMGMVGSEYFERFSTWIVDLSTQFNDFIQSAAEDGRLNEWIEEAITSFKDVWSILGSGISIFNSIATAAEAAGIGGLGVLSDNLEKAAAIIQGPAFQQVLTQLFDGAATAARMVGQAVLDLGPAIASVMPTISAGLVTIGSAVSTIIGYIGEIISNPALQQGLTDLLTGVNNGISSLAPAIEPLGTSLGGIGTLLGQVAEQVGLIVTAMVENLTPVLDLVTEAFGRITFAAGPEIVEIIEILGGVLGTLVDTLLPPLENLIMTLLPLLSPIIEALAPIVEGLGLVLAPIIDGITSLVEMIAPFLIPAFTALGEAITPLLEALAPLIEVVMSFLVPILGTLLIVTIGLLVIAFEGLSLVITGVIKVWTDIFTGFGEFFTKMFAGDFPGAMEALKTTFTTVWEGIKTIFSSVMTWLNNLISTEFVIKVVNNVKTAMDNLDKFIKDGWEAIKKIWNLALLAIGTYLDTKMTDAKKAVNEAMFNIGTFFSDGWNNIKNFISNSLQSIGDNLNMVFGVWKTYITTAVNDQLQKFKDGWEDMKTAVRDGINDCVTYVKELPGQIVDGLGYLNDLLGDAGKAVMQGFLDGLKAAWTNVTDFVSGVASWIADNKGPISYDRVLLVPAGNAIMEGLGKGLMDKLPMLKNVLETVTDTMTETVTGAFAQSKMFIAGADAALGLADGLKSNKNAVAGALSAVMPEASTSVSASLVSTRTGTAGTGGVGGPTPGGTQLTIEAGAIVVSTPTKSPELVAAEVIDEFANYSNL